LLVSNPHEIEPIARVLLRYVVSSKRVVGGKILPEVRRHIRFFHSIRASKVVRVGEPNPLIGPTLRPHAPSIGQSTAENQTVKAACSYSDSLRKKIRLDARKNYLYCDSVLLWFKRLWRNRVEERTALGVEPNFETCLLLGLEMLKRGAKSIDMHPWGLRLRSPAKESGTWSVGLIPREAQLEYALAMSGEAGPVVAVVDPDPNTPIAGEEVSDETTRLRVAPENPGG